MKVSRSFFIFLIFFGCELATQTNEDTDRFAEAEHVISQYMRFFSQGDREGCKSILLDSTRVHFFVFSGPIPVDTFEIVEREIISGKYQEVLTGGVKPAERDIRFRISRTVQGLEDVQDYWLRKKNEEWKLYAQTLPKAGAQILIYSLTKHSGLFAFQPIRCFFVSGFFLMLFGVSLLIEAMRVGGKKWLLLIAGVSWLTFGFYELDMREQLGSVPIRIDLLTIWPLLLFITMVCFGGWLITLAYSLYWTEKKRSN